MMLSLEMLMLKSNMVTMMTTIYSDDAEYDSYNEVVWMVLAFCFHVSSGSFPHTDDDSGVAELGPWSQ